MAMATAAAMASKDQQQAAVKDNRCCQALNHRQCGQT
jgi:hypothetical protein